MAGAGGMNSIVDAVMGCIPFAGDLFDGAWPDMRMETTVTDLDLDVDGRNNKIYEVHTEAVPPGDDRRLVVLSSMDVYRAYGSLHAGAVSDAVPLDETSPVRTEFSSMSMERLVTGLAATVYFTDDDTPSASPVIVTVSFASARFSFANARFFSRVSWMTKLASMTTPIAMSATSPL